MRPTQEGGDEQFFVFFPLTLFTDKSGGCVQQP